MKFNSKYFLLILIIIGAFLRFYNLNWGSPFYFHPDERNIATAVSQLSFPNQMNPHFFAYGSLPIYAIYFSGVIINLLINSQHATTVLFEQAIIISRACSALLSILLIPLIFLIGKKIKDTKVGLLSAFLATTSVGFIQYAHFGTFEMWLTFFSTLLFWFCLKSIYNKKTGIAIFLGIFFGVLIAVKVSSITILPIPAIATFFSDRKNFKILIKRAALFSLASIITYVITNPFVFIDYSSFASSMHYESGVVFNTIPVFYTGGFYNTIPVVFQFLKIYPFLINPLLTILFLPAFIYVAFQGIKKRIISYLLLVISFLLLFLPQAFLFAKWTRYIVPTLPFIYLIIAIIISELWQPRKKVFSILYLVFSIFILTNIIFGVSFFITALVKPDTRVAASKFAQNSIPKNASIISEPYDLGLTVFEGSFTNIKIFNFYEMDVTPPSFQGESITLPPDLEEKITAADYIILPSQRLLRNRILHKNYFPNGCNFYSKLINGNLGFKKIYETPCDLICKITYLGDSIFPLEETTNVFDRPTVMIFEKIKNQQ